MRAAYIAASTTGDKIFFYTIACLAYLAITQVSESVLERDLERPERGRA